MPIFWRPQLRVGHEDIDRDHRYLILLINTVELVLRFPEHPEHIEMALEELHRYAIQHFDNEEKIQIAWGYTHFDHHKIEHRRLLEGLDALRAKVKLTLAQPDGGLEALKAEGPEITTFLRNWLIEHVLKSDMKLSELFKKPKIH